MGAGRSRPPARGDPLGRAVVFLLIMTSRAVLPRPMGVGTALGHVRSWLDQPAVLLLQPGPHHLGILTSFGEAGVLTAALMTDAHLADLAIATRLNRRPAKGQAQKPALVKSSPM